MPDEFEAAVRRATADPAVKVIVLRGAGRSFCAGYDFGGGFHQWDEMLTTGGTWDPGKDFIGAGAFGPTQKAGATRRSATTAWPAKNDGPIRGIRSSHDASQVTAGEENN
jgi:enoyl-CoA hydratase